MFHSKFDRRNIIDKLLKENSPFRDIPYGADKTGQNFHFFVPKFELLFSKNLFCPFLNGSKIFCPITNVTFFQICPFLNGTFFNICPSFNGAFPKIWQM